MDFLEIRRKAKERAAREEPAVEAAAPVVAAAPEVPEPAPGASPRPGSAPRAPGPFPDPGAARGGAAPREPVTADKGPAEKAADARFTTWRPGTGERPHVAQDAPPLPQPALSDFSVFKPAPASEASPPPAGRALSAPVLSPPAFAPPTLPLSPPSTAPTPPAHGPLVLSPVAPPALAADDGSPWSRRARDEAERSAQPAPTPATRANPLDDFFFHADEEMPVALGAPPTAAEDASVEEYLTFRLGTEEYGVSIAQVHEVLKAPAITEVPRAPAGILGVVTVRGQVVAVFDPRRRLGLPGAPPAEGDGRIVIVDDGEGPCGLLVDAVASVVRLVRSAVEPCPQGIGGASADCLAGIGRERGRLFTVLDLAALLRRAPGTARRAAKGEAA